MKRTMLGASLTLIVAALLTSHALSQQAVPKSANNFNDDDSPRLAEPAPEQAVAADKAAVVGKEAKVETKIRELDAELGENPSPSQVELRAALKRYLARKKLDRIVADLEDVVKQAPGTVEATQAAAAIQALKVTPDERLESTQIYRKFSDEFTRGPATGATFTVPRRSQPSRDPFEEPDRARPANPDAQ